MSSSNLRTLKIKTGAVQRTTKDLESYRAEVRDTERRIDEIRSGTDHSMLKQWETVLAETHAMIPDSTSRLCSAMEELSTLIDRVQDDPASKQSAELDSARTAISDAEQALKR